MKIEDFLKEFNNSLNELPNEPFKVERIFEMIQNKQLKMKSHYVVDKEAFDVSYLKDIQKVVDAMMSIAAHPRFELKDTYEVKNRENVSKADAKTVNETVKRQNFWEYNPETGDYTPTKMVSVEKELSYGTYENRFIVMFMEKLLKFINRQINNIVSKVKYIGGAFAGGEVTYSDVNKIVALLNWGEEAKSSDKILMSKNTEASDAMRELYKIRANLYSLINSPFAREVKKHPPLKDSIIRETNIFLGEHNYRTCFEYYQNLKTSNFKSLTYSLIGGNDYRDYVAVRILLALQELGFAFYKKNNATVDIHLNLHKTGAIKSKKIYAEVTTEKKEIHVDFELDQTNAKLDQVPDLRIRRKSHVCFILNPVPIEDLGRDEYIQYIKELVEHKIDQGFDNVFVVTPSAQILRDDMVVVTPGDEPGNNNLKNALASCIILTDINEEIYSKVCPVCGAQTSASNVNPTYTCPKCGSVYSFMKGRTEKNTKTTLWIKRIKSKQ